MVRRASRAGCRWVPWLLAGLLLLTLAVPPPVARAASAVTMGGDSINLFYGQALTADAWSARDRVAFAAELPGLDLTTAYNQWLAVYDLRSAYYADTGSLEPGGVTVYPPGASAAIHALDLALAARERAILWLLGRRAGASYPDFRDLGYGDTARAIGSTPLGNPITPGQIGSLIDQLPLPPALFAGDQIFLMPYRLPQEYALTDVYGPSIRIWLGATATVDVAHVLYHELGHAVHFRFGGFDSTAGNTPLSAFWQEYLAIRDLTWQDPSSAPWAERTVECFAEDFAYAFRSPGDILGYQAACPVPTPEQLTALIAFWSSLPDAGTASPYQQAQWVRWEAPLPSLLFGGFHARLFTAATSVGLGLSLSAQASGGPYTVELQGSPAPLATLQPGTPWSGTVRVPPGGRVVVEADTPSLSLTSLHIYSNPAFRPVPGISGVFPDTLLSWARAGIAAAVRAGVAGGYPDGEFLPDAPVTRAELARMLAAALPGQPYLQAPSTTPYADVRPGYWAEPFVATVGPDLVPATPGALFQPNLEVTRQEAVAWVAKVFALTPLQPALAAATLATYRDGAQVSAADAPWFAAALGQGLVRGESSTGALRPLTLLTRAQAVTLVMRARHFAAAQASAA